MSWSQVKIIALKFSLFLMLCWLLHSWDGSRCVVDVASFRVDEITRGDIKFHALLHNSTLTTEGRYRFHTSSSQLQLTNIPKAFIQDLGVYENERDWGRTFCCSQVIYGNLGNFCVRKSDLPTHPSLHWRQSVLRSLRGERRRLAFGTARMALNPHVEPLSRI